MSAVTWYDTGDGYAPDCADCQNRLTDPAVVPAIHSVAISRRRDAAAVAREYINNWHNRRHRG